MNFTHVFPLSVFLFVVLFSIRNFFVFASRAKAIKAVGKYSRKLIYERKYHMGKDYFSEMIMSYNVLFLKVWLWNKDCAIKPKYKELLKEYF